MIYRTTSSVIESLLSLPESGMGYQIIDAKRQGRYTNEKFVVYNSELIVELNDDFDKHKRQILNEGYSEIARQSDSISLTGLSILSSETLSNYRMLSESEMHNKGRHKGGTGSIDNNEVYANGEDIFVRLSAYENDRRIDLSNKKLMPGSYTTTNEDYLTCKYYNDNPVDRYALPNDEEIKWAFYIQPKAIDKYRPGIVQPANGHSGGGIEDFFDNGTSNGTYFKKTPY